MKEKKLIGLKPNVIVFDEFADIEYIREDVKLTRSIVNKMKRSKKRGKRK